MQSTQPKDLDACIWCDAPHAPHVKKERMALGFPLPAFRLCERCNVDYEKHRVREEGAAR